MTNTPIIPAETEAKRWTPIFSPRRGTDNNVMINGATKNMAITLAKGRLPSDTKNNNMANTRHMARPTNCQNIGGDRFNIARRPSLTSKTRISDIMARTATTWPSEIEELIILISASFSGITAMAKPSNPSA